MKMVSKYLFGTATVILATASLYGCRDYLTSAAEPQGILNEQTLANRAGVEGTLIAAYRTVDCTTATISNWGCAASNWVWGTVASGDSYKGSTGTDQPPINDIEGRHWGTPDADSYLNTKWRAVYEGVVRANSTLRILKSVVKDRPTEFSTDVANSIQGEAIFLRAHYHFEAWRMWGSIPYYREDDTDFRKPNIAPDAVAVELLKDLDQAISLLPDTPRNGQKGRVTKWTAKAYKGRVQMYAGQYAAALATLRDVQQNGPYALESSFDHVWTGFAAFENGKETIFAYQASVNDGEPSGNNSNIGERLGFPYSGSHFGCCGFNQPTQNLVNAYRVDAASGLPLSIVSPSTWNASDANLTAGTSANMALDPRLDFTVGRDSVPYKDWGLHDSKGGWVRDPSNGGTYSPKKMAHEKASGSESTVGWQPTQLNGVNVHLFRYADVLLLLSEAEVEVGSLDNARKLVNQIRERAGQKAPGPGVDAASLAVAIDDPRITWAKYQVDKYPAFPSQDYAREAVRTERRLELAFEGQRLFDLRRWGTADVTINSYVNGVGGGAEKSRRVYLTAAEAFASRHRWFPIPKIQISMSTVNGVSTLKQNPGW